LSRLVFAAFLARRSTAWSVTSARASASPLIFLLRRARANAGETAILE
jgi:hypothetical protein